MSQIRSRLAKKERENIDGFEKKEKNIRSSSDL